MIIKEIQKPDKKSLQYLALVVIIAILVCLGFYYFLKMPEIEVQEPSKNQMKEIIKSLTAPSPGEPISEETQQGLSAHSESEPSEDIEDILENLTAPK